MLKTGLLDWRLVPWQAVLSRIWLSVHVQAAEVFKTVLSDMVAHRYTPFSRDSCSIVYEVRLLLNSCRPFQRPTNRKVSS